MISLLAAAGFSFGLPIEGTDIAGSYDRLYHFLVWLSIFFFVLVVGGMLVFAYKYRARPGLKTTYITHSAPLEVLFIGIPTLLLLGIFAWGYVVYHDMITPPSNAYEVRVTGKQWLWQFQYENGKSTINDLYVPMNRPVKLIMTSTDVLHGFFIPNFRVKQDVVPGMYSTIWFEAKVPGKHHLFCTEYCGTSHSGMIGRVVVLTPEQWVDWNAGKKLGDIPDARENLAQLSADISGEGIANAALLPKTPQQVGTLAMQGRNVFETKGCVACHSVDGTSKIGPSVKGLYGRRVQFVDGTHRTADDNYVRESILHPNSQIVQGYQPVMPTFQGLISESEMNALMTYVKELKE